MTQTQLDEYEIDPKKTAAQLNPKELDIGAIDLMRESAATTCAEPGGHCKSLSAINEKQHSGKCFKDWKSHRKCFCGTEGDWQECKQIELTKGERVFDRYEQAMNFRVTKTTAFNAESSRGHVVMTLDVRRIGEEDEKWCQYTVVD